MTRTQRKREKEGALDDPSRGVIPAKASDTGVVYTALARTGISRCRMDRQQTLNSLAAIKAKRDKYKKKV